MKAMILAAGKGDRMLPLTLETPKPLLPIGDTTLIQRHIGRLASAGITSIVVNVHHLKSKIKEALGNSQYGVPIAYSDESELLETAGGIHAALPILGEEPFVLVNGDLYTDYDFENLTRQNMKGDAHLVMVPNAPHHPDGDFGIDEASFLTNKMPRYTYAGIACYSPTFFKDMVPGKLMLRALFDEAIAKGELTGELFTGEWTDVGTPERYAELKDRLR